MTERGQYFCEQELMRHILPPDFTGLLFREPLMLNCICTGTLPADRDPRRRAYQWRNPVVCSPEQ